MTGTVLGDSTKDGWIYLALSDFLSDACLLASRNGRSGRDVVLWEIEDGVLKVGQDRTETGVSLTQRAELELEQYRLLVDVGLGTYVTPTCFGTFQSTGNDFFDLRVQSFEEGIQLVDCDLFNFNLFDILNLGQYHVALVWAMLRYGVYPENGVLFRNLGFGGRLLEKFLRVTPMLSVNSVYDEKRKKVKLLDTGSPGIYKKKLSRLVYASYILFSFGAVLLASSLYKNREMLR